jgi:hypothetical protein
MFPLPDAIKKLGRFEKDKDFRTALSCCWKFLRPLCEKSVHVEDYPEAKVITILGGHIIIEKASDRPFIHISRLNSYMDASHLAMYPALDAVLCPGEEVGFTGNGLSGFGNWSMITAGITAPSCPNSSGLNRGDT